jgi:hypothetical protein
MTGVRQPQHGPLYWLGITLLVIWNAGMLLLAIDAAQEYNRCVANDGFLCFDLSGPIFVLMIVVDLVVGLIVAVVHGRRARRARRSE